MIDEEIKPWLIEVNTNPCLEESSGLLRQLIPRMLDDAFRLTIDKMFPPLRPEDCPEQDSETRLTSEVFSVDGYDDEQNLWGYKFYKFRPPHT